MRIERVDDTTVKLFITYGDIESRGFKREDLWTNRQRGEEFFWSMMEEINEEEDFVVEGPLWIQVHAFEKGVEVVISKSKNEEMMNMADDNMNNEFDRQLNELLEQTFEDENEESAQGSQQQRKAHASDHSKRARHTNGRLVIVKFEDLESVIDYAHHSNQPTDDFEDLLYMLNNEYYYAIHFDDNVGEEVINDFYSQLLEFTQPSDKSEVYLNDYGKIIMSHNVTAQVRRFFTDTTEA